MLLSVYILANAALAEGLCGASEEGMINGPCCLAVILNKLFRCFDKLPVDFAVTQHIQGYLWGSKPGRPLIHGAEPSFHFSFGKKSLVFRSVD